MRKAETKKLDVDLTIPLNIEDIIVDSDCFGKEYLPGDGACSVCAVHEVCASIKAQTVKKLGNKIKKPGKEFIDEWNFKNVPETKLLELISNNPKEYVLEDIFQVIEKKSNCSDYNTVKIYMNNFLLENGIIYDESGKLYKS